MTTNVVFLWSVPQRLREYLQSKLDTTSTNLIFLDPYNEQALMRVAEMAHIAVGWRPSVEFLLAATNLKLFINPGVGVQHIVPLFRELRETREIILVNGHGNTYFVAQTAVAMLLTLMSRIILHHNWMLEGKWRTGDKEAPSVPL